MKVNQQPEDPNEQEEYEQQHGESYQPGMQENRWIFDYQYLYLEIKAKLKGGYLRWNKRFKHWEEYVPSDAQPFMNEKGVNETMALLNAYVNKIHAITYYDEERIRQYCLFIADHLSVYFHNHMDEFDLTPHRADQVIDFLMLTIESNLRKNVSGQSFRLLGGTEQTVTRVDQGSKQWLPFKIPFT